MPHSAPFSLKLATADDAASLAVLHTTVADHLTSQHGRGPWSAPTSETGVRYAMRMSQVFVARLDSELVGTLRLATKKPWAIDVTYFSPARRSLYLLAMAIIPRLQLQGLGRRCLEEVARIGRTWPADAVRLDAYDASAGAGGFYARCGWAERGRASYRGAPLIYYELLLSP